MTNLLRWMDKEMTSWLRSGAVIRKNSSLRSSVNACGAGGNAHDSNVNRNKSSGQCYVCKASHYIDQCTRFQMMTPNERLSSCQGTESILFMSKERQRPYNRELLTQERMS